MMRGLALLGLVLFAGCDKATGSQSERALWNALDIRDYSFVYRQSCICTVNGPDPAKLTVRGGVVVQVEPGDSAVVFGPTPPAATYPTVDSLFVILEKAQRVTPDGVTVEFDPTYHFPKRIFVDPVKNATDDEITYSVEKFIPSSAPKANR
jgi:hypothetical protein